MNTSYIYLKCDYEAIHGTTGRKEGKNFIVCPPSEGNLMSVGNVSPGTYAYFLIIPPPPKPMHEVVADLEKRIERLESIHPMLSDLK